LTDSIFKEKIREAIEDSFKRLIAPSLEREIRSKLKDQAEEKAIEIFSTNLRALLLQSPLSGQIVMAIDPGFRTGSKVCVVDEIGNLLETNTIYPHPPQNNRESSARTIAHLVKKYEVDIIAVGNGTASRETEFFLADLIKNGLPTKYTIVDEAGASVYSASKIARNEFPELDVAMRGAISIARRLQDPLAELVKIEPRSIGVGMYQHDISQSQLTESLAGVVESVVNYVGVDLNTASRSLLEYVSGIKSSVASKIVAYREKNGRFATREQLRKVYGLGPKTFEQSAGFLRINSRKDPLASTPIHPESYFAAVNLLALYNFKESDILKQDKIKQIREKLSQIDIEKESNRLDIGKLTLEDIVESLKRPGRDPREQLPGPVFRTDVLKIDDLQTGMLFKGKVRNVVDFGAFIDIGLKQDGLVHISEMSTSYVNDPLAIVNVGETVEVKVIDIDEKRGRIGLSMKF